MAIFKLKRDCMHETWWRDYYEIEAESIEDAIQMVLSNDEVEPYDTECLLELKTTPVKVEILDDNYEKIYESE